MAYRANARRRYWHCRLIDGVLALRLVGWEAKDSGYIDQIRVGSVGLVKGVNNDDVAFNYTGNAGTAKVKGVEFEFGARPVEYFRASIAGSYQHAYLTQGATAAQKLANPTLGVSGEDIPTVPKFQVDVGLNYTRPINSAWNGLVAADANYRGAVDSYFASNKFNIPLSSYTLVNLRSGVENNLWSITAFARNLTNKRAEVSAINSSQDPEALLTVRPRTIGVTVNRNF